MNAKLFFANILLASAMLLLASLVAAQEIPVAQETFVAQKTEPQNLSVQQESVATNISNNAQHQIPLPNTQPAPVTPFYQNTNNAAPKVGSGSHLLTVTLGLMAIVGLIFALSWFVKRFTQGGFSGNAHIKILSAMPLGTRERLVLVEAGGQQLLIGVTANNINTLHVLTSPIVVSDKTDMTSEFSKKLMAIMQQKTAVEPTGSATTNNNNAVGRS